MRQPAVGSGEVLSVSFICLFMLLTFLFNHVKSNPSALGTPPNRVFLTNSAYAYPIFTPFFGESALQTSNVPAGGTLLWVHTFFTPNNDYTVLTNCHFAMLFLRRCAKHALGARPILPS
jgi:hypothetical protein